MKSNKVAIAVIIFNRPDLIDQLFSRIRIYAPPRIYLIADGPRKERSGESAACLESQAKALAAIDWPCQVVKIFSEENLGCRLRIVSGLDILFQNETKAIILEDDTYPSESFFSYCENALRLYEGDKGVFTITGTRLFPSFVTSGKPCLSEFTHIWGWATWKDRWALYDRNLDSLGDGRLSKILADRFPQEKDRCNWRNKFERIRDGELDTWDYQLQASAWLAGGKCLTPAWNLVSNVGFRPDATHTTGISMFSNLKLSNRRVDIWKMGPSRLYDTLFQVAFHNPRLLFRCANRVFSWAKRIV